MTSYPSTLPANKLQLSICRPLRKKCTAPGSPHPTCQSWRGRNTWGPRPLANLGLLGGSERRNYHAGCHTSAVHHMGWSPSRHILQSHPRAAQVPCCGCGWEWLDLPGKRDWGRGYEWPHGCYITETSHVKKNTIADTHGIYFTVCIWAGRDDTPSRPGSSTKEATTTSSRVFSPSPGGPHPTSLRGCLPAGSPSPVWSLHPRFTGDDHLPLPSDRRSPLLPSGLEPG